MYFAIKSKTYIMRKLKTKGFLLMSAFLLMLIACTNYGTKLEFNGVELYYTSDVEEAEAKALGEYLVDSGFADGNEKSVQLNKEGSTYEFRMVVKEGMEKDEEYIEIAKVFAAELSETLFDGEQVDIHLCDDKLKTLRVVVAL